MIDTELIFSLLPVLLPVVLGAIPILKWKQFKKKLHDARLLIAEVDDAVQDDKVTEGEFRAVFSRAKHFINS